MEDFPGRPAAETLYFQCGMAKKKKKDKTQRPDGERMRGCPSKMGDQKSDLFRGSLYSQCPITQGSKDVEVVSKHSVPSQSQGRASLGEEGC